jgi:septum formation protein
VLEKPASKEDNLRMLLDQNGAVCEVVTGVTIGTSTGHK